ncbi:hypothetical protein P3X46_006599 [Hevea brasiliensis]|uniref:Condensin complex subunit 2 n=1 Tax=Hevea brasiliensis TaxID=3981 RepID=A0ABQ9MQQ8_HEVBR|nr:hypothetical protein P3X46_006599 [Hevea brasiliensis]
MGEAASPRQRTTMAYRLQSPINSFFLASNNDQLERAQVRAARVPATRLKATTFAAPSPPDPCLSKQQIIELQASYTLEAGVKIYSVRVDAVLSEAYKVLDGLGRASLEGEPVLVPETSVTKSDNVKVWQDRSHFKKNSGKKTSAQFDEGGAKGLLLNNLGVYGGCQVLFDSFEVPGKCKSCLQKNDNLDMIDISFAKESIEQMEKNILAKNEISPTLGDIICHFDEDNQRSSETFGVGQKFDARANVSGTSEVNKDNNSFGNFEPWAYNNDNESSIFNESFPNDSALHSDHQENDLCMSFKPDVDQSFENVTMFLFEGLGITSGRNMWAGPDHWKFQKYRSEDDIDFIKSLNRKRVDIFAPPKSLKSLLLPAKQAPCSSTLPEDCQYQPENLVKLFLLPNVTLKIWSIGCLGHLDLNLKFTSFTVEDSNTSKCYLISPSSRWGIIVQYDLEALHIYEDLTQNHLEWRKRIHICLLDISWSFPIDYQAAAVKDISPCLCFIYLLHLANEYGVMTK